MFSQAVRPPDIQCSVSKHRRKDKKLTLTSGLASSFLIHHQIAERRGVAPFMLALLCYCQWKWQTI